MKWIPIVFLLLHTSSVMAEPSLFSPYEFEQSICPTGSEGERLDTEQDVSARALANYLKVRFRLGGEDGSLNPAKRNISLSLQDPILSAISLFVWRNQRHFSSNSPPSKHLSGKEIMLMFDLNIPSGNTRRSD